MPHKTGQPTLILPSSELRDFARDHSISELDAEIIARLKAADPELRRRCINLLHQAVDENARAT